MIISDGYSIVYEKKQNRIVIGLPQTVETARNTVGEIAKRKTDLSTFDLTLLLKAAIFICKEE